MSNSWARMDSYPEGKAVWVAFFIPETGEYVTHAAWKYNHQATWGTYGRSSIQSNLVACAWQAIEPPKFAGLSDSSKIN